LSNQIESDEQTAHADRESDESLADVETHGERKADQGNQQNCGDYPIATKAREKLKESEDTRTAENATDATKPYRKAV
jgi:hypothetical protein